MTAPRVTLGPAGSLGGERAARLLDALDLLDGFAQRRIAKVEADAGRQYRDRLQAEVMPGLVDALERYFVGLAKRLGAGDISTVAKAAPFYETLDWSKEGNLLKQAMAPAITDMYGGGYFDSFAETAASASAVGDLAPGVAPNLQSGAISLAGSLSLADYDLSMTDTLGQRIVQINETTRANVARIVAQGIESGVPPGKIARGTKEFDGIRAYVAQTYKNRARVIALTETASAYNLGSLNGYKAAGVQQVRVFDGDDCGWTAHDDPDAAAGSIRTLEEAESQPTAHPNCQRSWSPYFADEKQTTASAQGSANAANASDHSPLPSPFTPKPEPTLVLSTKPPAPSPKPQVGQPPPPPSTTQTTVPKTTPGEFPAVPGADSLGTVTTADADVWAQGWQGNILDDLAAARKAAADDFYNAGGTGSTVPKTALDDLVDYTGTHYMRVNGTLRGVYDDLPSFYHSANDAAKAKYLADMTAKAERISTTMRPLPQNVKVWRGTRLDAFGMKGADSAEVLKTIKPGARFFEDGFSSTSVSRGSGFASKEPGRVRLTIEVPKGTKARYVDDISNHQGEKELLLDKGQEFVVKSVDAHTATSAYSSEPFTYYDVVVQVVPAGA